MSQRVGDLLKRRANESFVGRKNETAALLTMLAEDGPIVMFVHGIAGIGKSRLLDVFLEEARERGATVVKLDCRSTEPTPRGFFQELGAATGSKATTAEEAAGRLGRLGRKVVLALDTYELYRAMDTWLRQVLVPALPDNVRVVLFGREAPVPAWLAAPEWAGLFQHISLGPLRENETIELLSFAGVQGERARRISRLAHGHPLALRLAASAVTERLASELEEAAIQRVVEQLTRLYLADVSDPITRKVLEAASVIRCSTQSLLGAMLPNVAPQDAFERLQALPFVENGRDGLVIHDAVHEAIAASLKAGDPNAYRDYRRAAWRQLRTEVRSVGPAEFWRYTADMLYIMDNPHVRGAFFPTDVHQFAVGPASREDGTAIEDIIGQTEGPESAKLVKTWWRRAPDSFRVAHDSDGKVVGFISMSDPATVNAAFLEDDPVLRRFSDHLRRNPVPKGQHVLFTRRWLARETGELLSPIAAACFLHCKGLYMAMRPNLRRVYIAVSHYPEVSPLFLGVGFQFLEGAEVKLDNTIYCIGVLDMGPGSVDGWLARLVAAELGVEEGGILDIDARELVLDGRRVALTPLEFGVMNYLYLHEGKAVSRAALIENIWGYSYDGGSNVVDTVVLSLRKKLGERFSLIQAVRGVGYRYRAG
ncbi:MAG: winged helix-turn-helix domain-containing protein [Chloroflexi bacterium]|nr:winged helix-turn-helix domain-containing protein [Chloroflexota bacterium]